MHTKKQKQNTQTAAAHIIELMIAMGITITLLIFFFISTANLYTVYNRPDIDFQAKSLDLCEILMTSPGQSIALNYSWEYSPDSVKVLALGTTPLKSYGIMQLNQDNNVTIISQYNFSLGGLIGISESCFLKGTQIVMADETYKNIEEVQIGDIVKSFDEQNKKFVNRKVSKIYHHSPDEMTDYYLIINNCLRVTPNHKLYINNNWISANNIKIGDKLNNVYIYSIKKIYEQVPTFNLEIEKNHNYLVKFQKDDILVHNAIIDPPSVVIEPIQLPPLTPPADEHLPSIVYIDWRPWIPATKDIYPEQNVTFEPYNRYYYIDYTNLGDGNYSYETKMKTNYPYNILDLQKILNFTNLSYDSAKTAIGLDIPHNFFYNFNITISNETSTVINYGPSYENANIIASTVRNILIYSKPVAIFDTINQEWIFKQPSYNKGQITVRVFQ